MIAEPGQPLNNRNTWIGAVRDDRLAAAGNRIVRYRPGREPGAD
jgi:hypothetical protein